VGKKDRTRRLRSARQQQQAAAAEARLRRDGHIGPMRADTPATRQLMAQVLDQTEMPCRATFIDSLFPGAGTVAPVTDITDSGEPIFDLTETRDPVPVLMFEPERMVMTTDTATGTTHDLLTEALVSGGFTRVPPLALLGAMPADGWELYRTTDGVVLLDPYGGTVAEGRLTLDPEWVSAAASSGQVLVLIGPRLGIRVPPGRTLKSYTADERLKEFHQCRHEGHLIAAVVGWRGPERGKALKWVLLRQGSLGLALPLAYVPAASFRAHGGAEAFGFTTFLPPDAPINEPSLARGLAAELTATDLDLIRPDVERELGWICGYRPDPGGHDNFEAWGKEARRRGYILVASGEKDLPTTGSDCAKRAFEVLMDSVVAAVPLTPSSRSGQTVRGEQRPGA
jgi:hypothetical protein